jgi:hypothetical protein
VIAEEVVIEEPAVILPPPLPKVREAVINFGNKTAIAISVMAAGVTLFLLILFLMAIPNGAVAPLLFCAGGFLAATVYTRASGERLTPQNGARIGFLTCLWGSLVVVLFVGVLAAAISSPETRHAVEQQMQQMQEMKNSAQMTQTIKSLENPGQFISELMMAVVFMFLIWTVLSVLGGIIGARFSNRHPTNR